MTVTGLGSLSHAEIKTLHAIGRTLRSCKVTSKRAPATVAIDGCSVKVIAPDVVVSHQIAAPEHRRGPIWVSLDDLPTRLGDLQLSAEDNCGIEFRRADITVRMPTVDEPVVTLVPASTEVASLPLSILARCAAFTGDRMIHPILATVSLETSRIVGCDGHRMHIIEAPELADCRPMLIPALSVYLCEAIAAIATRGAHVSLLADDKAVTAEIEADDGGTWTMTVAPIQGVYPNVDAVVPISTDVLHLTPDGSLLAALQELRCLDGHSDWSVPVVLDSTGTARASAHSATYERHGTHTWEGDGIDIAFNPRYLAAALLSTGADAIETAGVSRAATMRGTDGSRSVSHHLMPVRLP